MGRGEPYRQENLVFPRGRRPVAAKLLSDGEERQDVVGVIQALVLEIRIALLRNGVILALETEHVGPNCGEPPPVPHDARVEHEMRGLYQAVAGVYCDDLHDLNTSLNLGIFCPRQIKARVFHIYYYRIFALYG